MEDSGWLRVSDVRKEVHKDIFAVLLELESSGWKLRRDAMRCPDRHELMRHR